jgi:hypothetical protein
MKAKYPASTPSNSNTISNTFPLKSKLVIIAVTMPQPHVNNFYRIWFTWFDPIVILLTIIACISNPSKALEMLVPPEVTSFVPEQAALMYQQAPLFGFLGIMFAVLLRVSPDPKVWRVVQAATLAVDVSLIVIMAAALQQQGRLSTAKWRGIEWFNMFFTACIALGRVAYLMGIGGSEGPIAKKRV